MSATCSRFRALAAIAGACLSVSTAQAQVDGPRCDGFPPQDHRFDTKADVVGFLQGPCFGQLYPVVSDNSRFANAATIQSLVVVVPPKQGQFRMVGLREFRYQPSARLRGWDRALLRLTYTLPEGQVVRQTLTLRLTSDDEYRRMRATGTLD